MQRTLLTLGKVTAVSRNEMDLSSADSIRACILSIQPNLIVNAAAYTAVDKAESEPALAQSINADAVAIMAEEAKQIGAAILHYSTDYVFDGTKPAPYIESDPTHPLSVYGKTKLAGEQALTHAEIPHLILRTSWVYGARGKNFLRTILKLAAEKPELRIVADQTGAPTSSREIAIATALLVQRWFANDPGCAFRHLSSNCNRRNHLAWLCCGGLAIARDFPSRRSAAARPLDRHSNIGVSNPCDATDEFSTGLQQAGQDF